MQAVIYARCLMLYQPLNDVNILGLFLGQCKSVCIRVRCKNHRTAISIGRLDRQVLKTVVKENAAQISKIFQSSAYLQLHKRVSE